MKRFFILSLTMILAITSAWAEATTSLTTATTITFEGIDDGTFKDSSNNIEVPMTNYSYVYGKADATSIDVATLSTSLSSTIGGFNFTATKSLSLKGTNATSYSNTTKRVAGSNLNNGTFAGSVAFNTGVPGKVYVYAKGTALHLAYEYKNGNDYTFNTTSFTGEAISSETPSEFSIEVNEGTMVLIRGNAELYAIRFVPTHIITATASSGGSITAAVNGTTNVFSSIESGVTCEEGTTVTITATPDDGYAFRNWSTGSTDNPLSVTVDGDKNLIAYFHHPINEAKTWTFEGFEDAAYTSITSIDNELYLRATNNKNITIGTESAYTSHTFTGDESATTISKSATLAALDKAGDGTSAYSASGQIGALAFETSVPGKVSVVMKNSSGNYRIYNSNSISSPLINTSVASEPTEYSVNTPSGTIFISGVVSGATVYAVRFVPETSVSAPTIKNNNGTITITAGVSSVGATVKTYYTTDGSNPTSESTLYSGTFAYPAGCTQIKAVTISDIGTSSEVSTKAVPTIPTALASNPINFSGLETSAVTVDDEANFTIDTGNKKYTTGSASASTLYINNVSFCYSTNSRVITLGTNYLICGGAGLTITIPGLTSDDIVILSSSSNNSSAVTFSCTSGGEILSGATTSIQTDPTNLIVKSTGGNMVLTTATAGLRLYSITVCKSLAVSVAEGQSAFGTAEMTTTPIATDGETGYFTSGSSVTVTAAPTEGYYFVNWKNGETEVSTNSTYTFDINSNLALTANFATKSAPTVENLAAASLTYNGAAQNLVTTPTVTGGTISYSTTEDGTYGDDIPQGTDAASYSVWYKLTGDDTHSDVGPTQVDGVSIGKADFSSVVIAEVSNQSYTGSSIEPTPTVTLGGVAIAAGEKTYSYSYENNTAVGTSAKVILTPANDGNFSGDAREVTFTIVEASMDNITATPYNAEYDGAAHGIVVNGVPEGAIVTYSVDGESYQTENFTYTDVADVRTVYYKVTKENYNDVTGSSTVTITQATNSFTTQPTITNWAYGETANTPIGGVVKFGVIVYKYCATADGTYGTYNDVVNGVIGTWYVKGFVEGTTNYTAAESNAIEFQITEASIDNITATAYNAAYDGAAHGITLSNVPNDATVKYRTTDSGEYDLNENPTYTNVSTTTVYYKVSKDNYTDVTGSSTVTITPATLTATAQNASRNIGEANPEFTVVVTGFVNGETADNAAGYTAPTATCAATEESSARTYDIIPSGGAATNYTFSYVNGTLTVNANTVQQDDTGDAKTSESYSITDATHAEVTTVTATEGATSVTIPASVNGVSVTSIADNAFSGVTNKSDIKSIDLSATSITGVTVDRSNGVFNGFPEETMIYIPLGNTAADEQKNVIINGTCSDFQMTDTKSYSIPTGFTADKATLKRSFTSDKTCTVCLPYAMTEAEANAAGTFYFFSGISGNNVQMTQKTGGLEANVPYIFVPSSNANSITATGSISVSMSTTPQTENTDANFTFKGVYGKKEFSSSEISSGVYGFAASPDYGASIGQFVKAANGAWVEGMRAYLAYSESLSGTEVASTRGMGLPDVLNVVLINAKGDTTNIGRLELMTADDGSPVYNLNGQRVDKSYKGIVIKNGKKVVMK